MRHGLLVVTLLAGTALAAAAESQPAPKQQVSVGFEAGGGASFSGDESAFGTLVSAEYEYRFRKWLSAVGRLQAYDYNWEFDDGGPREEENGDGVGVGGEARFWLVGEAMKGFYVGAGVSAFPTAEWDYCGDCDDDNDDGDREIETGDETVISAYVSAGYNWQLKEHFGLTPTFIAGQYITDSPEGGFFAGIGLRFNVPF